MLPKLEDSTWFNIVALMFRCFGKNENAKNRHEVGGLFQILLVIYLETMSAQQVTAGFISGRIIAGLFHPSLPFHLNFPQSHKRASLRGRRRRTFALLHVIITLFSHSYHYVICAHCDLTAFLCSFKQLHPI